MSDHGNIKFWQEIGRRNVLRVAAVYVGFSWAVVHSGVVVGEALELPHWIMRLISALLIVGFPAVVAFAWVYEITPEGLKRSAEVEKDASLTHRTAQRLNIVLIALVAILIGLYGADRFLLPHEAAEGSAHTAAETAPKAPAGEGISIAVLPFLNLSSDKEQEFFSDGMTEEITSALAKVKGLRVVGRTSAFEFKGQNKDLHAIGIALRASHLLEGSVRKEGNQIRVTAQLIRSDDGTHIWTENYDRELKSVFAIQDEISQAIAGALRVPLGLKAGGTLVTSRTADPEIHQQFLRAKAIYRARVNVAKDVPPAIDIGEQVVARDPAYAPAWALLAQAYAGNPSIYVRQGTVEEYRRRVDLDLLKAESAGRRAIELDPQNADSYVGLALALQSRGKYLEAEDLYKLALKLDAFNPDLLHFYSQSLLFNGRIKEAVTVRQQLLTLEPLVPNFNDWTARILTAAGQYEAALPLYKSLPPERGQRGPGLVLTNILLGRGGDAADAILGNPAGLQPDVAAAAVRLLRMPPTTVAPQNLPDLTGTGLTPVYLYVGAPERYFQGLFGFNERQIDAGYHYPINTPWGPAFAPARKTERFKALMRKLGLVDYWRARGWPDHCHPVGKDDFQCD